MFHAPSVPAVRGGLASQVQAATKLTNTRTILKATALIVLSLSLRLCSLRRTALGKGNPEAQKSL